jgi:hypothetical protein
MGMRHPAITRCLLEVCLLIRCGVHVSAPRHFYGHDCVAGAEEGAQCGAEAADSLLNPTTNEVEQRDAEALKAQMASVPEAPATGGLDAFPAVAISPKGTFKYVLIEAQDATGRVRHLVRGSVEHAYHVYCARATVDALRAQGFESRVLGGGRMVHKPNAKAIAGPAPLQLAPFGCPLACPASRDRQAS